MSFGQVGGLPGPPLGRIRATSAPQSPLQRLALPSYQPGGPGWGPALRW